MSRRIEMTHIRYVADGEGRGAVPDADGAR